VPYAERMKFSAMLVFTALWSLLVYAPVAHMVWSGDGGFMWDMGVLDFAGGTVVHINAGVGRPGGGLRPGTAHRLWARGPDAAQPDAHHRWRGHAVGGLVRLQCRLGLGRRRPGGHGHGRDPDRHGRCGPVLDVRGVGSPRANPACWASPPARWAGWVAITPASGFVGPTGALIIGLVAGVACYWGATSLKRALKYDDSLDAFGVHGVGGVVGALLTGIFAVEAIGGTAGSMGQFMTQLYGTLITIVFTAVMTFIILKIVDMVMGLRVTEEQEREGLDIALHGERVE
jgi:Amt family ammonium transporter